MTIPNSEPVVVVGSGDGNGLAGGFGNAYYFLSIDKRRLTAGIRFPVR